MWYRNNKRKDLKRAIKEGASTVGSNGTLKLKRKRKQQAWQAYHAMTYESQWKAVIDVEWSQYVKDWTLANPDTPLPMTRFAFMNNFMRAKFAAETDEVKAEVERYREAADDSPQNAKNAIFQQ